MAGEPLMHKTVEIMDPETGETFVAAVPIKEDVAKLQAERDELLAALKGVCSSWKKHLLPQWNGAEDTLPVPDEVSVARALIARIEGK